MDDHSQSNIREDYISGHRNPTSEHELHIRHEYARPTNDWCFKHIFGDVLSEDGNQNEFTRNLLNSLLELSGDNIIKEVSFRDPVLHTKTKMERSFITDIHCTDHLGRRFIIEMQVYHHSGWAKRLQAYVARDYSSQMSKGDKYNELLPVHLLAITEFNMFPSNINYLSHHAYAEKETKECFFPDTQITVLELPKFKKNTSEIVDQKDRWAFILKNAESMSHMAEKDKLTIMSDPLIRDVCERMNKVTWNEEELAAYERSEDNRKVAYNAMIAAEERGLQRGRTEGIKEGEEKAKKEFDQKNQERKRRKIEKGVDPDDIKEECKEEYSDYDEAEIDEMIKKAKKSSKRDTRRHG
ncbi:Rpn family recombination-promoting nuclease/putative transposase [Cardinium endosymbiont of Culicoides punctatus]|uniref:Rpn family recombination-promoting nuclease/putative transposase n=2 Tax=Cardinium endosymbiont of Culicoides punctatus TaxID=2304601 RepID=UPI0014046F52|nr:Rpn family recombination-promoting nuclease/putative transposase [Cardinium endosymbiont of Culicoides punctatus]